MYIQQMQLLVCKNTNTQLIFQTHLNFDIAFVFYFDNFQEYSMYKLTLYFTIYTVYTMK